MCQGGTLLPGLTCYTIESGKPLIEGVQDFMDEYYNIQARTLCTLCCVGCVRDRQINIWRYDKWSRWRRRGSLWFLAQLFGTWWTLHRHSWHRIVLTESHVSILSILLLPKWSWSGAERDHKIGAIDGRRTLTLSINEGGEQRRCSTMHACKHNDVDVCNSHHNSLSSSLSFMVPTPKLGPQSPSSDIVNIVALLTLYVIRWANIGLAQEHYTQRRWICEIHNC